MDTTVYFVRHAQPDFANHDDMTRELTQKGSRDAARLTQYFSDIPVTAVYSSPFRRAVDTVKGIAACNGLKVAVADGFRERRVDGMWIEDFDGFARRQWADFDFRLLGGECLREVQERNIAALKEVLECNAGGCIVIGSHGTALSTVINYFDPHFGYDDFMRIKNIMPWVVRFTFSDAGINIDYIDI